MHLPPLIEELFPCISNIVFSFRIIIGFVLTIFISYSVGRKIVTKRHDKDDDDGNTDVEDITSQYKNPEGI